MATLDLYYIIPSLNRDIGLVAILPYLTYSYFHEQEESFCCCQFYGLTCFRYQSLLMGLTIYKCIKFEP